MRFEGGIKTSGSKPLRILVVRADRLGDVILSTPVFEVIKRHYPRSHLAVMVRENVAPVIRGLSCVDEVLIFDPDANGRHAGLKGFFRLRRDIRSRQFRIAVILQAPFKAAAAVFVAQVRYRVGPLSKLYSFFFYNRGIRQRRSQVEMHETDYNLQLLRRLGIRIGTRNVPTRVNVTEEAREGARRWLESRGWQSSTPLVAVHPGMGGSALNWPENHYIELIRSLVNDGKTVLVTGGPLEGPLLARIEEALAGLAPELPKQRLLFYGGSGTALIDFLGGLYSWADLVVAPSTGPLHLAVALGKPVVTFYPPVRVQSAIRWGPYVSPLSAENAKAGILVPEVYCGEDFECRRQLCNYFPCMKTLTVAEALQEVRKRLVRPADESNHS